MQSRTPSRGRGLRRRTGKPFFASRFGAVKAFIFAQAVHEVPPAAEAVLLMRPLREEGGV